MAIAQQVVNGPKGRVQVMATLPPFERPLNGQRIQQLVSIAAQSTVQGFVAQDLMDFDDCVLQWAHVFHTFCPDLDSERVVKAAEAYTNALWVESKIKDDSQDPYQRVHDEQWQRVRDEMEKMCEFLEFPSSFASETCDCYRYHAVSDDSYVKHLLEAHRVMLKRLTGTDRGYRILAGLYLTAFGLHDLRPRTKYILKKALELMKFYYTFLFEAMYGIASLEA